MTVTKITITSKRGIKHEKKIRLGLGMEVCNSVHAVIWFEKLILVILFEFCFQDGLAQNQRQTDIPGDSLQSDVLFYWE